MTRSIHLSLCVTVAFVLVAAAPARAHFGGGSLFAIDQFEIDRHEPLSAIAFAKRSPPPQEQCVWCPDQATGTCVMLSSNNSNCGACGKACPSGQVCGSGTCQTYENYCSSTGQAWCGSTTSPYCATLATDPQNCNACGNKCPSDKPVCENGQCNECWSWEKKCNGTCTPVWDSPNCGQCGVSCVAPQICNNYPNGTYDVANSVCTNPTCDSSSILCPTGCVNVNASDVNNCGACGKKCATSEVCMNGQCLACSSVPPTYGNTSVCNGQCTYTDYDNNNCGSCGNKCALGLSCLGSQGCVCFNNTGPAPPKITDCTLPNGTVYYCRDLANDDNNCGSCGNACPSITNGSPYQGWCDAGTCSCANRYNPYATVFPILCGNGTNAQCVDPESDNKNCGACGVSCKSGEQCYQGTCYPCSRLSMLTCTQLNNTCMSQSTYDYSCPGGTSYTGTTTTATATTTATVAPKPTFSVTPGEPVCMRSCSDKQNYVLVRKIVQDGTRQTGIQCIGPNPSKCAWFTDDKCTKVATGESAPDPSYDTGYICPQHTSGWCGAAYSYLWVSPGTPIPGNCPAPAPPTSNEPAISVGAFQCIRSCVDKGNYLWMRSGVIQSTGVLTVQCSGQSTSSCGWFSDAACTKVVPGETGGGDSGIVCNQVLTGWCEAGWDVLALNSTQQSCSFVTTSVNPSAATTTRTGTATAVPSSTAAPVSTSSKPSAGTKSTAISFFVSAVVGLALVLVTFA